MKPSIGWCGLALFALSAMAAEPNKPESQTDGKPAAKPTNKTEPTSVKNAQRPAANSQLGMSVTGTQEAPKVLYIVPWKTLDAVPAEPYVSGLLDEVFSPVDPVVFERSVHQHEQIQSPQASEQK
jgi:hypothetical protein